MRDISKVFQGLYLANKNYYETKEDIIKLWAHEVMRVFQDRLMNEYDRKKFQKIVNDQMEAQFSMNYNDNAKTGDRDAVFVAFLQEDEEIKVYEEVKDFGNLRGFLNEQLDEYNR